MKNKTITAFFIFLCCNAFVLTNTLFAKERLIEVKARKFSYTPNLIRISKGDTVHIRLISEDVHHGFFLDGYNIRTSAHPGQDGSLTFVANKTGRFSFRCSVTCGEFHPYMVGYLVVNPNSRFYAYLFLTIALGLAGIFFQMYKKNNTHPAKEKLFGLIDMDARFELTKFKPVRALFKSRWFPLLGIIINLFIFTVILLAGFFGGYSAGNYNFGIMIVWILWWVLLMFVLVPVLSRTWCMVCPFPIFSDWSQRKMLFGVRTGKLFSLNFRWPKSLKNMWIMNIGFLVTTFFSGFFTVRPLATFVLLGAIILIAYLMGLFFDKRIFCLYVCPVSGFQGLYSQFAMTEIRRRDPEICKTHSPKTCYVGNEQGYGCPWLVVPYNFTKNTYCGMCLECFKSCPHDNMAFNLRPPGTDLLIEKPRGMDEAWKSFIMLGVAVVFFLTMQGPWGVLKDMVRATTWQGYLSFIVLHSTFSLLAFPGIFLAFSYVSKVFSGSKDVSLKKIFINFSYTLVPLGLGVWIAFSFGIILPNGSYILHILSDPFAWGWDLFGTANFPWTPVFTRLMGYLQGITLVIHYAFSIYYGFRLSKQTFATPAEAKRGWIPMFIFLTLTTIVFLWLYIG
ncbi:MAG: cupredoxin domain-containing protein [bacterium]